MPRTRNPLPHSSLPLTLAHARTSPSRIHAPHTNTIHSPPSRLDLENVAKTGTEALPVDVDISIDKLVIGTKRLGKYCGHMCVLTIHSHTYSIPSHSLTYAPTHEHNTQPSLPSGFGERGQNRDGGPSCGCGHFHRQAGERHQEAGQHCGQILGYVALWHCDEGTLRRGPQRECMSGVPLSHFPPSISRSL